MNMIDCLYRFDCAELYCTALGLKKQLSVQENRGSGVCRLGYTLKNSRSELFGQCCAKKAALAATVWSGLPRPLSDQFVCTVASPRNVAGEAGISATLNENSIRELEVDPPVCRAKLTESPAT